MRVSRVFHDNMVILHSKPFSVWGFDAEGIVTITLEGDNGKKSETILQECGKFQIEFPGVMAGYTPYKISIVDDNSNVVIQNIVFGEVFLSMGQSNMSYPLSATEQAQEYYQRMKSRNGIRVLSLAETAEEITRPQYPQEDLSSVYSWTMPTFEAFLQCSAVSTLFAMLLNEEKNVPVGVIMTAMGGLSIESYLPREIVEKDSILKKELIKTDRYVPLEKYNQMGARNYTQLSGIYNEKIAPLFSFKFSAMLWYLGESSAYDFMLAKLYEKELRLFIAYMKEKFEKTPFVAMQISPEYYGYGDNHGYLYVNEAIQNACREIDDCYCIPTFDIQPRWLIGNGDLYFHPIHPTNKFQISKRICDVFLGNQSDSYFFPEIGDVCFGEENAICTIRNSSSALCPSKDIKGFTIAGENGKYYQAFAKTISSNKVEVWSEFVKKPRKLTYAFKQYQSDCDLVLQTGEPVLPYRTIQESISKDYFFTAHFAYCDRNAVFESCFSYDVGMSKEVPLWTDGMVYTSRNTTVSIDEGKLRVSAKPTNSEYYFFGVSPNICISGQPHYFGEFSYLSINLSANVADVKFYGIAVRLSTGETFRFPIADNEKIYNIITLSKTNRKYGITLKECYRQDMAVVKLDDLQKKQICAVEFLWRSQKNCDINLSDMLFFDCEEYLPNLNNCEQSLSKEKLDSSKKLIQNK